MTRIDLDFRDNNVSRVLFDDELEPRPRIPGWAICTAIDGDSPSFAAFFLHEDDARHAVDSVDADGERLYFDASVELAFLTPQWVIISNNVFHKTHADLLLSVERLGKE